MALRTLCPGCGCGFEVEDGLAGRSLRCPQCLTVFKAPAGPRESPASNSPGGLFDRDQYFMNQKVLSLIERYTMLDENGTPLIYVERPVHYMRSCASIFTFVASLFVASIVGSIAGAVTFHALGQGDLSFAVALGVGVGCGVVVMAFGLFLTIMVYPKRHIYMYSDKEKQHLILKVFQDQKVAFINHRFTVADETGNVLGIIRKNMLTDIFRKAWRVYDSTGDKLLFVAREDSILKSMLRRLLGPMLGLLRTNFVLMRPNSEAVLGELNRKFTIIDKYVLDLTADTHREVDRRLAVALAIMLDTGERR